MTSLSPNMNETETKRKQLLIFLTSLIVALVGGAFLLVLSGLVLGNMERVGQTAVSVNITSKTPWYFTRSSGTVAYLLLAGSTIWGLLLSSKIIKEGVPAAVSLAMHNILSWLALALTTLHALALFFDSYYTYRLADITIPFIGPYRPEWVGLGIIGFYLMFLTSISFSFRKQIGQKRWRKLHVLAFFAFILVTAHGVMAGTDSGNIGMTLVYLGSGLLVLFLTNYRILTAGKGRRG
ncbi:MAG: ferric reductase-like transmembrane domain-containing protein [Chloroflexi bacterium]|nr:ferric reductase-like transmembrane domain-containing protein [Chloroflexota bacterium]